MQNYKYVVDGGEWSQLFADALEEYEAHQFDTSLLKYLFLGELGYEKAQSNAAHILETYILQMLSSEEDNFRRAFMMWKRAASQGACVCVCMYMFIMCGLVCVLQYVHIEFNTR